MTTLMDRPGRSRASSRSGAKGAAKRRSPKLPRDRGGGGFFRRLFMASSLFLFLMVVTAAVAVWVAWVSVQLPPDKPTAQTTTVTDINGKVLDTFNAGENREPVELGQVPPVVLQAIIDTEDHNYYTHHGVDPRGTARALYIDVRQGTRAQGGSTITQQYVKQVYVGTDRTLWRKFKEAILAVKLEQRLSKDEVLERYVNTIYWGRGAYGVQTASRAYFNKDVEQLGLQEAAYLAGLIKGPELADAYKSPDTAKSRRARTLVSMVRYGTITAEKEAEINAIDLKKYVVAKAPAIAVTPSSAKGTEYFVDYVKSILVKRYGEQLVESGGLKVKTTLDASMQNDAYDSVYGFLKPTEPDAALVSLDQNGHIKAMVGGRDYKTSQVNLAVGADGGGSGRQAGSTFKAFELASAVEEGACFKDTYSAPPSLVIPGWDSPEPVSNFDNESFSRPDLIESTVHSVNTVYAQMVMEYGVSNLVETAKQAGITSKLQAHPSLVLGADSVTPLEMADAYLTFAQGGVHVASTPILEVKNADDETLERAQSKRTRVFDAETANVVNYALQQVVQRGTGTAARVSGKAIAGKTGTTDKNGDAWFVGYTPTLSTAVWMGYAEGQSHTMNNVRGIQVTGGTFPAQMFSSYMKKALKGQKESEETAFTQPKPCKSRAATTTSSSSSTSSSLPKSTSTTSATGGLQDLDRSNNGRGNRNREVTTSTVDPDVATTVVRPATTLAPDRPGRRVTVPTID